MMLGIFMAIPLGLVSASRMPTFTFGAIASISLITFTAILNLAGHADLLIQAVSVSGLSAVFYLGFSLFLGRASVQSEGFTPLDALKTSRPPISGAQRVEPRL